MQPPFPSFDFMYRSLSAKWWPMWFASVGMLLLIGIIWSVAWETWQGKLVMLLAGFALFNGLRTMWKVRRFLAEIEPKAKAEREMMKRGE